MPYGVVALDDYMSVHWPGVTEVTTYRNPLEHSPQALTVIAFHSMAAWQQFVSSRDYQRMMHEIFAAQRAALVGLRNSRQISSDVMRRVEHELDLEESRLEV